MIEVTAKQGDITSIVEASWAGISDLSTGWTCHQSLVDSTGVETITDTEITDLTGDNSAFECKWDGTQTGPLSPGVYTWAIRLDNNTLELSKEEHAQLTIETGYVANL